MIDLGRRDAMRWLRRHPSFWCRDASHDLSFAAINREALWEREAIEEFRAAGRPR
jgi:NTE family protein